ncbi:hypothetical protein J6590_073506 [Homalodisca vitripennis]|nr:hypothetical protein J6590_073506 [Homalodisca vitripennis]
MKCATHNPVSVLKVPSQNHTSRNRMNMSWWLHGHLRFALAYGLERIDSFARFIIPFPAQDSA